MSRLNNIYGLLVIVDDSGKVLSKSYNLVLKQGYDMILGSLSGDIPQDAAFLDKVTLGNGKQSSDFYQTDLFGDKVDYFDIESVKIITLYSAPVIELTFTLPPNSNLDGTLISEAGLWCSVSELDTGLFSHLNLETPIPVTASTTFTGYYYLSFSEQALKHIFNDYFDHTFQ